MNGELANVCFTSFFCLSETTTPAQTTKTTKGKIPAGIHIQPQHNLIILSQW